MHYGVKFITRDQPQPSSIIVSEGTLEDMIFPIDYVEWKHNEWNQNPLLPIKMSYGEGKEQFETRVNNLKGRVVGMLLSLERKGIVNEYIFYFRIENIQTYEEIRRFI